MPLLIFAVIHHANPWYYAVPFFAVAFALRALRMRRGGRRASMGGRPSAGPFGGGRYNGPDVRPPAGFAGPEHPEGEPGRSSPPAVPPAPRNPEA